MLLLGFAFLLEPIAGAMTQHLEVIETVATLTFLIAIPPPLSAAVYVFDGIFIGANDAGYLLKAMALSSFVFFVPAVFVTVGWLDMGIVGTWLAYDLFMIGRFVTLLPGYRGDKWQRSIVST